MRGILVYNSSFINHQVKGMLESFSRAFKALNTELLTSVSDDFLITYDGGIKLLYQGGAFEKYKADFAIFWDKDIRLVSALEFTGIPVFNCSETIEVCDNKLTTYEALCGCGVPVPLTIAAPFVYNNRELSDSAKFLKQVEEALGFPMVVKEAYGSLGMQVYLINNCKELYNIYEKLKHTPHLYQQFIKESTGLDIRVYVIGGRAAGACERRSESDFRSNVLYGGRMSIIEPGAEYVRLAEAAAARLKADYCAVDFLKGETGPLLCEVNSNAFFNTYAGLGGKDIAAEYAEHILMKIKR